MKLKKLTPYYKAKARTRLRTYFDLATEKHIEDGMLWYSQANKLVDDLSLEFEICTPEQIAGIISALSPRNKWERNIYDTTQVLRAVEKGKGPEDIKVCTFNTNKHKAFEIARGNLNIAHSSRKTHSFVKNIANLDSDYVTIDVWHLRAMFGKTVDSGLTPSRYDELAKITIEEASEVGLLGYQYQAIVWECIRERDNLI
jgi:hypothetical protein